MPPGPHVRNLPHYQHRPAGVARMLRSVHLRWHLTITPSPEFCLQFLLGVVHSAGLDKCVTTRVRHYRVIQSAVISLSIQPCLFLPSLPLATTDLFSISSFAFSRLPCSWNHAVCWLLPLMDMCLRFSMAFYGSIVPTNHPLSVGSTVPFPVHPPKDVLVGSKFGSLWLKLL